MKLNDAGKAIIKRREGLQLEAYVCPAGKLTVGYGHTGPDVKAGLKITKEKAEALFDADTERFSVGVKKLLTKTATDNQFSAFVSFAYNVGLGAFAESTMRRRFNEGKLAEAAKEFDRWVYANGKKLSGLVSRRAEEKALFLKKN